MPSYAIHLAIANEVIRKEKNNIVDKENFILGTINPDLNKKENLYHIGEMEKYIKQGLKDDYDKGYFLHIFTDYRFRFFDFREECINGHEFEISKWNNFYSDYNKLAPVLIRKYKINNYPKEIGKYMQGKESKTEYIEEEKLFKFIDIMSDFILDDIIIEFSKVLKIKED